jgi:hypothetical protein
MKWFRKSKDADISISNLYVVNAGTYGGDYLILIDQTDSDLNFLVLPDMLKRTIQIGDFKRGIENKIVIFIEKLPKNIFKTCKTQYEKINNKNELC